MSTESARKTELKTFAEEHRTGYGIESDLCQHYLELLAPACQTVDLPTAEELARKAFIAHFGRDGFAGVEVKERDFILQWLDWGLEALREIGAAVSTPRCPKCGSLNFSVSMMGRGNQIGTCGNCDCNAPVAQFFQPAPSPPQWVSVKERMPEFHKQVLSWDGKRQWVDYVESVTERRWHTRREITHWQPLPIPPVASPQGESK